MLVRLLTDYATASVVIRRGQTWDFPEDEARRLIRAEAAEPAGESPVVAESTTVSAPESAVLPAKQPAAKKRRPSRSTKKPPAE